jgi:hypothetical protein
MNIWIRRKTRDPKFTPEGHNSDFDFIMDCCNHINYCQKIYKPPCPTNKTVEAYHLQKEVRHET